MYLILQDILDVGLNDSLFPMLSLYGIAKIRSIKIILLSNCCYLSGLGYWTEWFHNECLVRQSPEVIPVGIFWISTEY